MTRALLSEAAVWSLARVLWLHAWVLPCCCTASCPEPHRRCMGTGRAISWVPAGAWFVGGKSLLAWMPRCCKTLLRALRCSTAAGTVLLAGRRGSPSQPQPALSLRQPLLGTPLLLESSLFTSPPSWHVFCLHSHPPLRAEAFLRCPQRPVPDQLQVPVSSRAVNASVTERRGRSGVLNVSLPTSAFSLTA